MTEDITPERPELPENIKETEAHIIINNMGLVASRLQQISDPETGKFRAKRYGAWLGVNIIPHLHEQMGHPDAPLILPEPPNVLIAADTLEELGERLKFEVDVMVQTAQDVIAGKIKINDKGTPVRVNDPKEEVADGTDIPTGPTADQTV